MSGIIRSSMIRSGVSWLRRSIAAWPPSASMTCSPRWRSRRRMMVRAARSSSITRTDAPGWLAECRFRSLGEPPRIDRLGQVVARAEHIRRYAGRRSWSPSPPGCPTGLGSLLSALSSRPAVHSGHDTSSVMTAGRSSRASARPSVPSHASHDIEAFLGQESSTSGLARSGSSSMTRTVRLGPGRIASASSRRSPAADCRHAAVV